ncbi:PKD domain-containing protein (plasmid) [Alkalihalophilus sp. As8PL]|uniref:PKD domain-containing protein n=1 Tax=Alkalihalophilus sp. As8PL TaxID=3237103 RepID=A0AB39BN57_9BACI
MKKRLLPLALMLVMATTTPTTVAEANDDSDRVRGAGSAQVGSNSHRTYKSNDESVIPPLGFAWYKDVSGNPNIGFSLTNYRIYYGVGNTMHGLNNQTAVESTSSYTAGNPFRYTMNGNITSHIDTISSASSGVVMAAGLDNGRVAKITGTTLHNRPGEQVAHYSPNLGGGPIRHIGYSGWYGQLLAASDSEIFVVDSDTMQPDGSIEIPNGGKVTGITNGMYYRGIVFTDHGDGRGYGYIIERPDRNVRADYTIQFLSGVPKAGAYHSNTLYTVDKEGRFYAHDMEGNRIQNIAYVGNRITGGDKSVGGVLIHDEYAYTSSLQSRENGVILDKGTVTRHKLENIREEKTSYVHHRPVTTTPVFISDLIYFGDSAGDVWALNPSTMELVDWYLDETLTAPVASFNIGQRVEHIIGADNHLYAAGANNLFALKGRPDFGVQQSVDNQDLNGKRFNYTGNTLPTIDIKQTIRNDGSFDYSTYRDFGGISTQKVNMNLRHIDGNTQLPIDTSRLSNNALSYHQNTVNDFQVPAKKSYDLMYRFSPTEEGEYRLHTQSDSDGNHTQFGQVVDNSTATFQVVDMSKPTAKADKDIYRAGETVKFSLETSQKYSLKSYMFEVTNSSGGVVFKREAEGQPPNNVDFLLPGGILNGTYNYRITINNRYGDTIVGDMRNFQVERDPPSAGFTMNPNPSDRLRDVTIRSTASHPNDLNLTHAYHYRIKGNSAWQPLSTQSNFSNRFSSVATYEIRQIVTDQFNQSDQIIQELRVNNLAPTANFSGSPNPTDRTRNVQFTNTSNDSDGDTLTYRWEQRLKGTSSWSQFSTTTNPNFRFPQVGTYEVRLTATDSHGANHTRVREVVVNNLAPTADFSIDSTPTNRLTPVSFTNTSTDPEDDDLTYVWEIKEKEESSWTQISTSRNTSYTFPNVATYEVRLTTTDTYNATHSWIREVVVENLPPNAAFIVSNQVMINDHVNVESTSSDPEGDTITHEYVVTSPTGEISTYNEQDFSFQATEEGNYKIHLKVTDSYGSTSEITHIVVALPLSIVGYVNHTEQWNTYHNRIGNHPSSFYSGELFVLEAVPVEHDIDYVNVTMVGNRTNGSVAEYTVDLVAARDGKWVGELYDESFEQTSTQLKGSVDFTFSVQYSNGTVREDIVTINIIGSIYDALNFYRTN